MEKYYENDVERPTSTTSFENMLLFLLSYVSKKKERNALEEDLAKLYAWAIQMVNYPPAGSPTSRLDSTAGSVTLNESLDEPCVIGQYSEELRQYLQE